LITHPEQIASEASLKEEENIYFREYIDSFPGDEIDQKVSRLNNEIAPSIDCQACGACCRSLMINVDEADRARAAARLQMSPEAFSQQYLEEGLSGRSIMKAIPCSFLQQNSCSIYTDRFLECREFPHFHKKGFKSRVFGILMFYGKCPIIYNVIEALKKETGFIVSPAP
jgi:uncharacterized protein